MPEDNFTQRVIHGLKVAERKGDHRLYCERCKVPLDRKRGDCTACNELRAKWREARILHYADTRHPATLARMVVELEDTANVCPEFTIDEEWPT